MTAVPGPAVYSSVHITWVPQQANTSIPDSGTADEGKQLIGYRVIRSSDETGTVKCDQPVVCDTLLTGEPSCLVEGLQPSTKYSFQLLPRYEGGGVGYPWLDQDFQADEVAAWAGVDVVTQDGVPSAPVAVVAHGVTASTATLRFHSVVGGGNFPAVTSYTVRATFVQFVRPLGWVEG